LWQIILALCLRLSLVSIGQAVVLMNRTTQFTRSKRSVDCWSRVIQRLLSRYSQKTDAGIQSDGWTFAEVETSLSISLSRSSTLDSVRRVHAFDALFKILTPFKASAERRSIRSSATGDISKPTYHAMRLLNEANNILDGLPPQGVFGRTSLNPPL
jgi:hypothetical protein